MLVVEDEAIAARRLVRFLSEIADVHVCGVATDGREALSMIASARPHVVFLDIEMPYLNGLEVVRQIDPDDPPVIVFVTAFSRYAADAFRLAAVDYLVKPTESALVSEAVERARNTLRSRDALGRLDAVKTLLDAAGGSQPQVSSAAPGPEIWIRVGAGQVRVAIAAVEWVAAEGDYVRIHTPAQSHFTRSSLQDLQEDLGETAFLRVHRSALVNYWKIQALRRRRTGAWEVVLTSGAVVPVGRRHLPLLRDRLKAGGLLKALVDLD